MEAADYSILQWTSIGLHGVTTQKIVIILVTAVRTSHPRSSLWIHPLTRYAKSRAHTKQRHAYVSTTNVYICCLQYTFIFSLSGRWWEDEDVWTEWQVASITSQSCVSQINTLFSEPSYWPCSGLPLIWPIVSDVFSLSFYALNILIFTFLYSRRKNKRFWTEWYQISLEFNLLLISIWVKFWFVTVVLNEK
jgi:hypothetical protein